MNVRMIFVFVFFNSNCLVCFFVCLFFYGPSPNTHAHTRLFSSFCFAMLHVSFGFYLFVVCSCMRFVFVSCLFLCFSLGYLFIWVLTPSASQIIHIFQALRKNKSDLERE